MKEEKAIGELEKPFDYGKVSGSTELKAAFFGEEDEMIVEYLKRVPNSHGVILANLVLYFCYRYGLMSERRLRKRLSHLVKMNLVSSIRHIETGLTFYKAVLQK